MAEDWLEVYQNCANCLNNNLRLNEISILTFFQFYFKITRSQLEIVVKATYGFEKLHLTFWERNLVTKRFWFHSNSRGADEIKGLIISIDLRDRNTELLPLFSIISPWFNPPYSIKVKINVGKLFIDWLINTSLATINFISSFNFNSVKLSYSCMRNMKNIIQKHN